MVNGVPSCHLMFGRSFQVVSIEPSGFTRHVPVSIEGSASPSCGFHVSRSISTASLSWAITLTLPAPPAVDSDAELRKRLEIVLDPPHTRDRADSVPGRV